MNPLAFKVANAVIPPIGWVLCSPSGYGRIGHIESSNKIRTIEGVEFSTSFLGGDLPVAELVDRVQRSDRFRALWLAEGLGLELGRRALAGGEQPQGLLTEGDGRLIPEDMLLMVHAGFAMAFARHHLDRVKMAPSAGAVREATQQIVARIDANSIPGYSGIAYEAWGMATRFFYPKIFPSVIEAMGAIDPGHAPHMWHGAGRASYFFNFMPRWREPWPAFKLVEREGRERVSRLNLLAGLGAVVMIVNMRTPEVMEAILRERVAKLSSEHSAAFAQGIACSMVMRQDTVANEEHTLRFVRHVPSKDIADLWERIVGGPSRQALETIHPRLRAQHRLDEITCYRPLEEILSRTGVGQDSNRP